MSAERWFIDTNVLVYVYDNDSAAKQARARDTLEQCDAKLVISPQVLGEFFVTITRKLTRTRKIAEAAKAVEQLRGYEVQAITGSTVSSAIARTQSSMLSYWDALIVESAIAAGANRLLTEDLSHGQQFDGLEVTNPFAGVDESL